MSRRGPGRLRVLAREDGFTLVEMLLVSLMLVALASAVAGVLVSTAATTAQARVRTAADQLAAAKIEMIRALPYDEVGLVGGNPPGRLRSPDPTVTEIAGAAVRVTYAVGYVDDPAGSVVTYADYKKVVVTVTRSSDGALLAQKTTYVAASAAAPDNGQDYVAIKRQVVDMDSTSTPLAGVSVSVATGPSAPRSDATDASGSVLFPALTAAAGGSVYDVTASLAGYSTFPQDLPTWAPGHVTLTPGQVDGPKQIRLYRNGISLTVNLVDASGSPFTGGAAVYVGSPVCGQVASVPAGSSSTTIASVVLGNAYAGIGSIPIPPMTFTVSAQSGSKLSAPQQVTVPRSYPSDLTQAVTLALPSSGAGSMTPLTVTVTKGGAAVPNAHVEVANTSPGVYLFGLTNASGVATFSVPSSSTRYAVTATDALGATATTNVLANGSDPKPTLAIS